jgi:putative ABC transport system ATP-binding protein
VTPVPAPDQSCIPPAVRCQGLAKSFRSTAGIVQALRGIDLDVPAGRLTMLVGPSGCGKTTLISVVAGILAPDAGRCRVLDVDVAALSPGARLDFRARRIGFIFQQFHLLPSLVVADNVAVPLIINGVARRDAQGRARAILDQVGLADRWQDPPAVLSGGEQQRVAIARALVHAPDLIVCDEPTSALDHDTGQRIMALLADLVRLRGMSVLIVTHDNRIFPYADRIARMDDGRVVDIADNDREPGAAVAPPAGTAA